jgi:hypothetical protein
MLLLLQGFSDRRTHICVMLCQCGAVLPTQHTFYLNETLFHIAVITVEISIFGPYLAIVMNKNERFQ